LESDTHDTPVCDNSYALILRKANESFDFSYDPHFKIGEALTAGGGQLGKRVDPIASVGCISSLDLRPVHPLPIAKMNLA
jgi:hypothetical protein